MRAAAEIKAMRNLKEGITNEKKQTGSALLVLPAGCSS
jgi:hypothetical protein